VIWRGEVYDIDLGQPIGHEPGYQRQAVVVSVDIINNGPGGLVTVIPVTSRAYGLRSQIELDPGMTGLDRSSHARCDQIRSISTARLARHRGRVNPDELTRIDQALRFVLDL
jgi:mRNA interferase MazF